MITKNEALRQLAIKRKADRIDGHKCFGDFYGGAYDKHEFVVPWTISAHNVDAEVMIMGQDWNSETNLSGKYDEEQERLGQKPKLASNRNLKKLLEQYLQLNFSDTYATDLFAFVKPGGMSANIPSKDLLYSAQEYALPQIKIVRPRVVICLGGKTYNALRRALGGKGFVSLVEAQTENLTYVDAHVLAVTHTGGQAFNMAKKDGKIEAQWLRIASLLRSSKST